MTDEVLPRRLPHDPNSFGAGLMRSAIEQGFPSVGGKPAPAWTREAPEDPGFYWWRFVGHKQAETVELDGWGQMRRFADDREWEMAYGASGEFWPVRLEPPAS